MRRRGPGAKDEGATSQLRAPGEAGSGFRSKASGHRVRRGAVFDLKLAEYRETSGVPQKLVAQPQKMAASMPPPGGPAGRSTALPALVPPDPP